MTQLKKRSLWTLLIWSIALVGMLVVYLSGGGPSTFLETDRRVELTRIFITAGYVLYFIMLILTRIRSIDPLIKDERDEQIARRAYMTSFYTLLYYVFLFSLFLYWFFKIHKETAVMPVGWVWILAVSSMCVGFICSSAATLIYDARMSGHGQS